LCFNLLFLLSSASLVFGQTGSDFLSSLVYDATKTYDEGDSVIPSVDLSDQIYTARKSVPIDTPPTDSSGEISNTDYWATSGDYTTELATSNSAALSDVPDEAIVDIEGVENLGTPTEDTGDDNSSLYVFNPGFRQDGSAMDPSIPIYFDVDGYFQRNHDVRDQFQDQSNADVLAYEHYIEMGIDEDRMFDNDFVPLEYVFLNIDLRLKFDDGNGSWDLVAAVDHWFNFGKDENRTGRFIKPDWFDAGAYMDTHHDVRDAFEDSHFGAETEAWWHFYRIGAPKEDRSWDDSKFTLDAYIAQNIDIKDTFQYSDGTYNKRMAMYHYITDGHNEGRKDTFDIPSWFDGTAYLDSNADVKNSSEWGANNFTAFNHFWRKGAPEGRIFGGFNVDAYLEFNPDVDSRFKGDKLSATIHFIADGFNEGRKSSY